MVLTGRLFGAWVGCCEDSCKQKQERVLVGSWKEALEDLDMQSDRVVLDRLEWSGATRNAPGNDGWSDAIQMWRRRRHRLSLLALTFILRRWPG